MRKKTGSPSAGAQSGKVVKLSVHKNTRARKQRQEIKKDMQNAVREITSSQDTVGYVMVGFDKDGEPTVYFDPGPRMPLLILPDFVKAALTLEVFKLSSAEEAGEEVGL